MIAARHQQAAASALQRAHILDFHRIILSLAVIFTSILPRLPGGCRRKQRQATDPVGDVVTVLLSWYGRIYCTFVQPSISFYEFSEKMLRPKPHLESITTETLLCHWRTILYSDDIRFDLKTVTAWLQRW